MQVQWIKLRTDIFDDEKIKLIDAMPDRDAIFVVWIKLLALAGRCNSSGVLMLSETIPYTDEMLAAIFARPIATVRLALSVFDRFGMIECGDRIRITNWDKHQNEAMLREIRDSEAERKRLYRRKIAENTEMSGTCPGHGVDDVRDSPVLDIDIELDKEKREPQAAPSPCAEAEKDTDPAPRHSPRFIPPSPAEVRAYVQERGSPVNPESFVNFYESKGWLVGKAKMKDWRAAVRTWESKATEAERAAAAREHAMARPPPSCPLCGRPLSDGICVNAKCSQYDREEA